MVEASPKVYYVVNDDGILKTRSLAIPPALLILLGFPFCLFGKLCY
jgi:hypothetical protein